MLLQVSVESHRLQHHFLVYHRRIEQVQTVLLPDCKAQMRNVQPLLVARNGNDIAILDCLAQCLGGATQCRLRYIARLHTSELLFLLTDDGYQFGLSL